MSDIGFTGFKREGQRREQDLPPRPKPQPIPTKETKPWVPVEGSGETPTNLHKKMLTIKIVSAALPIVGSLLMLGIIGFSVVALINIYK